MKYTGYDLQQFVSAWLRKENYIHKSVCEVILDDDRFNNLGDFTRDAIQGVRSFQDDLRLQQFSDPDNERDVELRPLVRPGIGTAAEQQP